MEDDVQTFPYDITKNKLRTSIVSKMMNRRLTETWEENASTNEGKWIARKTFARYKRPESTEEENKEISNKKNNLMRGLPNTWCQLLNMFCRPCLKCNIKGVITNAHHLKTDHGINIKSPLETWEELISITTEKNNSEDPKKMTLLR